MQLIVNNGLKVLHSENWSQNVGIAVSLYVSQRWLTTVDSKDPFVKEPQNKETNGLNKLHLLQD